MSLAMTQFGPSIEPITFPTPSGYTMCYATDAGYFIGYSENTLLIYENIYPSFSR